MQNLSKSSIFPQIIYAMSESSLAICQLIITKFFAKNFVMKFENNKEIVKMTKRQMIRAYTIA